MKLRYEINDKGVIIRYDAGFTAKKYFETDENLSPLQNINGGFLYKVVRNAIVSRTQAEIEKDAEFIEKNNEDVKKKLIDIDIATVRSMREYIAKFPDAPEFAVTHEKEAKEERKKLIKE